MPLSLPQARLDARSLLQDPTPALVSDGTLDAWLSQGQRAVAALTLGYQRRAVYRSTDSPPVFIPGLREYAFEGAVGSGGMAVDTALRVLQVYLDGQNLPRWTAKMVSSPDPRAVRGGTPRYWYQFGPRMGFVPYPSSTFVSGTWSMDVMYADLPEDWTTGDSVLPAGMDELPTYFAAVRALLMRRQWTQALQMYKRYLALLQQYQAVGFMVDITSHAELVPPVQAEREAQLRPVRAVREAQRRQG